ncbi:MAG: S9 family peptidase [Acidobacteriales bacterium]|nr:S9 family peptidase [Terriglobales bacterium]
MTTLASTSAAAQKDDALSFPPAPPAAKKVLKETKIHGDVLKDDYFWLREKQNPEVRAYLESENAYTDAMMAHTKSLQDSLYKELVGHIKETDQSAPYRQGNAYYYTRVEAGKQYTIYCRRAKSLDAPEEIVLDENKLAEGEKFMKVDSFAPSDDGNLLAYSTDNTGFRQYVLRVRDLRTGKDGTEQVPRVTSVAWANDNQTLFYTVEDELTKRSYRLYRHMVGEDSAKDVLVYEEKDEAFSVGIGKARSGRFLILDISSLTTSEERFLPADEPAGAWSTVAPRIANQEYYVEHRGDTFYIRTNQHARNFEVMTAPLRAPGRENWKSLVPPRAETMVEDFDAFADFLVLTERTAGLRQIRILDLRPGDRFTGQETMVQFPEATYTAAPAANRVFQTRVLRYSYQSPITPASVYEFDMVTHQSKLLKQQEVPGGFVRDNYQLERVYATASDGVKVPVTVFYRKSVKRDGTAPLYLYSYGSYGIPVAVNFSSNRLALLDRGVVIALAHIRGGGDLGKAWHDDGRMMKKMNTFTDFIASAEFLVKEKYCDPKRIAIEGGSAGGLLMGAVTNLRPDLWKAVISKVPFVDVMNTMLDASLPLTVGEYEEWGNPNKKDEYDYMLRYSPYDNLAAKAYPTILVKTSFNDSQVMYWEPAKYVARLRTLKTDKNPLLLKTNMAAGHGGSSGRYDYLHDIAFDYAFLSEQLGLEKNATSGTGKK